MDKLTRESQDHKRFYESLAFFKASLEQLSTKRFPGFIEDINKFFHEYVVEHLNFEEEEIFSELSKVTDEEERGFIDELTAEHDDLREKVSKFKKISAEYIKTAEDGLLKEWTNLSGEIIEMMMSHTKKEDMALFDMMKKYDIGVSD